MRQAPRQKQAPPLTGIRSRLPDTSAASCIRAPSPRLSKFAPGEASRTSIGGHWTPRAQPHQPGEQIGAAARRIPRQDQNPIENEAGVGAPQTHINLGLFTILDPRGGYFGGYFSGQQ